MGREWRVEMQGHQDLVVWQKSMDLVVEIYRLTRTFPKSETYGLSSQLQRAAVSIPSNIAEGQALKQTPAYMRHLSIASGSVAELETQIEIARRLGYLPVECKPLFQRMNEVGRLLSGLRRSLRERVHDAAA
ncbi:MAG TPA: four helix bundle protein [Terriglobia bacterium]|nr:four helix bundle protein [Terriglobia bacterium]